MTTNIGPSRLQPPALGAWVILSGGLLLFGCRDDGQTGGADTETSGIGSLTLTGQASTTETGGDTDGSAGATGSTGPDDRCGEADFDFEAKPARVVLVLDKSRSMVANTWDHDEDPGTPEATRWRSLHATVDLVTTQFDGALELGMLLYPSLEATQEYNENACVVSDDPEVAVAPDNGAAVLAGIPGPEDDDVIFGGTPSATAIAVALAHLRGLGEELPRAILFVTDGEANCSADAPAGMPTQLFEVYDDNLHTVVEDGFQTDGIPTYVVGIAIRNEVTPSGGDADGVPDGINPHEKLDELAQQGGRPRPGGGPRYYATDNQIELEAALQEIAAAEVSCVVPLDPAPEHPNFVELEIGGQSISKVTDCATEDGWVFVNPDGPYDTVELCGAACELFAAEGTLDAFYGCPPPE